MIDMKVNEPAAPGGKRVDLEAAELLARVGEGEPGAVRACVEEFGAIVWSLALRSSATRADAEDATQEIFTDLWRSAGRFERSRSTAHGFVAMIARRRLIDRRRKQERRPVLVTMPNGLEPSHDEHEKVDQRIRAREALRLLEELKPQQKRMLELSLVHGMSHSQIADEMGIPLGTVKTGIRRGLAQVRAGLVGSNEPRSGGVQDP
jgi:RNA polymerase sigma-70 factor (ECF subfamily)